MFSPLLLLIIKVLCFKTAQCVCGIDGPTSATCDNFNTWSELNELLNSTQLNPNGSQHFFLYIRPSQPIVLTGELNISIVQKATNCQNPAMTNSNLLLTLVNISGIDVITPWSNLGTSVSTIGFEQSKIDFYINQNLASGLKCSKDLINDATFFTTAYEIDFLQDITYPTQPVCPFLFTNAVINFLSVFAQSAIVGSKINNLLTFQSYQTNETSINSNIMQLLVRGFSYTLNSNFLHPLVFERVKKLQFYGSISSIQPGLFNYFMNIDTITFCMINLKSFFHTVGVGWTQDLVIYPEIIFSISKQGGNWSEPYTYPDSDFCLFAEYPQQLNLTYILNSNLTVCTMTIRWLISNYFARDMSSVFQSYPNAQQIYSICKSSVCDAVDFGPFLTMCNMSAQGGGATTTTIKPCVSSTTTTITTTSTVSITGTTTSTSEIGNSSRSGASNKIVVMNLGLMDFKFLAFCSVVFLEITLPLHAFI
jgi:hypothetical protein